MVSRLLSTALVALLAVAMPAAADGDPAASGSASDPAAECLPLDALCAATPVPECEASDLDCNLAVTPALQDELADQAQVSCQAFEYNSPLSGEESLWRTIVLDPDGCWMAAAKQAAKRALEDLPPVHSAVGNAVDAKIAVVHTAFDL